MGDAQSHLTPTHPEELNLHAQESDDGGNQYECANKVEFRPYLYEVYYFVFVCHLFQFRR